MGAGRTLGDLVAQFGGQLEGDPGLCVTGFAGLREAGPRQMSFLANPRYRKDVVQCGAAAVLVRAADLAPLRTAGLRPGLALWVVADPYVMFARVAQALLPAAPAVVPGIDRHALVDAAARVDASASVAAACTLAAGVVLEAGVRLEAGVVLGAGTRIGAGSRIGAGCVLGAGVSVGPDCLLHPRVTVYDACVLGARAIVHAGAVIGADGFGFARDGATWVKIPQTGRVVIGDDVEIGANTTIDRGALADTVLGDGVKLDNQIQVGHNVRIGAHTAMAACVGIAGSAVVGARCTVGGGAIILGHLSVADDVHVSAASVVTHSLHQPGQYTGFYPIGDNRAWEKSAAALKRLPDLRARLRALEQALEQARQQRAGVVRSPAPQDPPPWDMKP